MGLLRRSAVVCAVFYCIAFAGGLARGEAVLLDFHTDWCGYCRMMEPLVGELAAEGYQVRRINGDEHPELVRKFRVDGYPTFVALFDGREVGRVSGKTSKAQLVALLEQAGGESAGAATAAHQRAGTTVRGQSPDGLQAARGPSAGPRAAGANPYLSSANARAGDAGWEPVNPSANLSFDGGNGHDRLVAASVRLRIQDTNGQSTGSGTIIDARDGEALIVTCGHVFREYQESGQILVDLFGAGAPQNIPGTLISYDLNSDVGLVRMSADYPFVAARVAPAGNRGRPGEAVVSVGCDHGRDATPLATRIVSVDRYNHAPNLQVAFEPVQGRSGGGLFNANGQLIGVCNAADAADNQGLFAALGAIHAELDRTKLSFVYQTDGRAPISSDAVATRLADVAEGAVADWTNQRGTFEQSLADGDALSVEERALLEELRSARGAEVICLVRALDSPHAKSRVLQINRASAAFWRELASDSTATTAATLTSLEDRVAPPSRVSYETAATPRSHAAQKSSTVFTTGHSDRVWPPRQSDR